MKKTFVNAIAVALAGAILCCGCTHTGNVVRFE